MLIAKDIQIVIPAPSMAPMDDEWEANRQIAAGLKRIGHGAQSELASVLGLPNSAVSNIVKLKRGVSARERDRALAFIDHKLSLAPVPARDRLLSGRVPVIGYVTAGGEQYRLPLPSGDLDYIAAPAGATAHTVAVQIRGKSLGELFDRWYAFYDDVRAPFTEDWLGRLCVVGLTDGRVMIKWVMPARKRGRYTLRSENEPPIRDVEIAWAARVKSLSPD